MSRPLRLLWLIDSLNLGGAESLVSAFARGLDPERIHLQVCCLKTIGGNPFEAELKTLGIPCVNLAARNLRDVGAFRSLLALIRDQEIDLIHAHLNDATVWAGLAARRMHIPWVATLHVSPLDSRWSRNGLRERLMLWVLRRWCPKAITVSAALRDEYLRQTSLGPDQLVVAHNGIDTSQFIGPGRQKREATRRELGLPVDAKVVVTVSVLRQGKGLEVLLDTVRRVVRTVPDARFVIVGDGPLREQLTTDCRARGLDPHVHWTGFRHDVAELLACGDLFVFPTLFDAFPTAILEAMGSGLPVIASRVGGVPEIIHSPEVGLLVPPADPDALGRATVDLLSRPEQGRKMGEAARQRILETFTTANWTDRLGQIYGEVVDSRFSPSSSLDLGTIGSG